MWQGQHLQGLESDTPKLGAHRLPPGRKRKLDRGHSVPVDGPSRLADPSLSVPLPPQEINPSISPESASTTDGAITPLASLQLSHPALHERASSAGRSFPFSQHCIHI